MVFRGTGSPGFAIDRYVNLYGSENTTWEKMVTEIDLTAEDLNDVVKVWQDDVLVTGGDILTALPPSSFLSDQKLYVGYQPSKEISARTAATSRA